jgi:dCTP diphosphatase
MTPEGRKRPTPDLPGSEDQDLKIEDRWLVRDEEPTTTTKRVRTLSLDGTKDAVREDRSTAARASTRMFAFDKKITLESLRLDQAEFAKERDWDQFHTPRNVLLAMVGEVGELSELFQWRGDEGCGVDLPQWSDDEKTHLGEEMADVLLYLVRLADRCGVNLPAVAKSKLAKNEAKYPADRCRGSAAKYTAYA